MIPKKKFHIHKKKITINKYKYIIVKRIHLSFHLKSQCCKIPDMVILLIFTLRKALVNLLITHQGVNVRNEDLSLLQNFQSRVGEHVFRIRLYVIL